MNISRRDFLKKTAAAGMLISFSRFTNATEPNYRYNLPNQLKIESNNIHLSITKEKINVSGNQQTDSILINKSFPAPTLVFQEDDIVTINVSNHTDEITSIHWHGFILPFEMDGVPGLTYEGIKPNETFVYTFKIQQSGTYWYHSHSGFQEPMGMYGAIIIKSKDKEPVEYNREEIILLSDWSDENPHEIFRNLKKSSGVYNANERTLLDFINEAQTKGFSQAFKDRKMWNKMSMSDRDISDVTGLTYTYLTNGKNKDRIDFKKGDKIRFRVINASSMTFFDIRIPGLKINLVNADGNWIQPTEVDEFRISVAETYDFILEPESGTFNIFAQAIDRSGFTHTILSSEGKELPPPRMDKPPVLTMEDMGMSMNMHDMDMSNNSSISEHATMSMNMNHQMDTDMKELSDMEDNQSNSHNVHNMDSMDEEMSMSIESMNKITPLDGKELEMFLSDQLAEPMEIESKEGPQIDMRAINPMYRLFDPGVGLRNNGRDVFHYGKLINLNSTEDIPEPDKEITLHLTGNMERYMWSINGIPFPEAKPLVFEENEVIRITFINDTMMNHPMHLHGMWSYLENGTNNMPKKHTVIVQPGSKLSIRVKMDAIGRWAFHCHMLYHMSGMFREVRVLKQGEKS